MNRLLLARAARSVHLSSLTKAISLKATLMSSVVATMNPSFPANTVFRSVHNCGIPSWCFLLGPKNGIPSWCFLLGPKKASTLLTPCDFSAAEFHSQSLNRTVCKQTLEQARQAAVAQSFTVPMAAIPVTEPIPAMAVHTGGAVLFDNNDISSTIQAMRSHPRNHDQMENACVALASFSQRYYMSNKTFKIGKILAGAGFLFGLSPLIISLTALAFGSEMGTIFHLYTIITAPIGAVVVVVGLVMAIVGALKRKKPERVLLSTLSDFVNYVKSSTAQAGDIKVHPPPPPPPGHPTTLPLTRPVPGHHPPTLCVP